MLDRTPKVFISYSWTSKEYQEEVIALATRLRQQHHVDVKLDVWDLRVGQDLYAYMEQCVTDPSIDKVLILCDKRYAEKANGREGGVGNETAIITPKVYKSVLQEKFIPVIMEKDEKGEACCPAYLASRKYVDMTGDNYENGYEELLRIIYEEPAKRKPELGGAPPNWLSSEVSSDHYSLKKIIKDIQTNKAGRLKSIFVQSFRDAYIEALKQFYRGSNINVQVYLDDFSKMKNYRDIFLEFVQAISDEPHFGASMADILEKLYNSVYNRETFAPDTGNCSYEEFDIFRVHVWELFICTVTYMLHFEMYSDINELLEHTYYLRTSPLGSEQYEVSYRAFRFHSEILESVIKPQLEDKLKSKFTLTGYLVVTEREYKPIFAGKSMANADLFLYQVYNGIKLNKLNTGFMWFPTLYAYSDDNKAFWGRLKSKQFCRKIMPIFGVATVEELKERISNCKYDESYRYTGSWDAAIAILNCVQLNEIATLP